MNSPTAGDRQLNRGDVSPATPALDGDLQVLAAKSHQLKTPLTVITSFARLLIDRHDTASDDPERRLVALEAIADASDELAAMLEKLLLSAKPEADRQEIAPAPTDLRRLLNHAITGFDVASRRHRIVLEIDYELPLVLADEAAVRTIVGELLENAIKYSPDGGLITVRAAMADNSLRIHGGEVVVSVRDVGIGLSESEAGRIFEPFFQGDQRDRHGIRDGVGLGLAIVARLIADHDGRCWAEGIPDEGAMISFTLPAVSPLPA